MAAQLDVERKFLERLASKGVLNVKSQTTEAGDLLVWLDSSCPEVGYLRARVRPAEISLSCKVTHTHADSGYHMRHGSGDPVEAMIEEAASTFADFVQGRMFVQREIGADGLEVSTGWRRFGQPHSPNPRYRALIIQLHGGPSTIRAWSWTGEVPDVEPDY